MEDSPWKKYMNTMANKNQKLLAEIHQESAIAMDLKEIGFDQDTALNEYNASIQKIKTLAEKLEKIIK